MIIQDNIHKIKTQIRQSNKNKSYDASISHAICNVTMELIEAIAQNQLQSTKQGHEEKKAKRKTITIKYIGSYQPFKYEVDIAKFNEIAESKNYAVTCVSNAKDDINFFYNDNIVVPEIVILPCIGIIKPKTRVGHGLGGYDKYFAHNPDIIKIAVCFHDNCIQYDDIKPEKHDICMDYVVTEKGYY